MPKTSQMKKSKFLKRTDITEEGVLVTIRKVAERNVARANERPDMKWCMWFAELQKPLVLNTTNINACERITGTDDTDGWKGKQIVLYDDPSIEFGGRTVGGIRVRKPRPGDAPPPPAPAGDPDDDDEQDDPEGEAISQRGGYGAGADDDDIPF